MRVARLCFAFGAAIPDPEDLVECGETRLSFTEVEHPIPDASIANAKAFLSPF